MTSKAIRIIALGAGATLVLSFGVGGTVYFAQERRIDELRSQLEQRDAELAQANQDLLPMSPDASETVSTEPSTSPTTEGEREPQAPSAPTQAVTQFAFVTKAVMLNGSLQLTLDYADYLTGEHAAGASAADGEESPPPNDYYISNKNLKLRVVPVAASARFTIAYDTPDDTKVLTPAEFQSAVKNNTDGVADAAYWFTIRSGTITAASEQWTP
jgi:hypothetical protein